MFDWIKEVFTSSTAKDMFSWIKPAMDTISSVGAIVSGFQQYKGGKKAAAAQREGAAQQDQAAMLQEQARPQFEAGAAKTELGAEEQRKAALLQEEAARIQEEGAGKQRDAAARQKLAADEKLELDKANVIREETETAEKLRRESKQYGEEEAMARAQAAASGFAYKPDDEAGSSIAKALSVQRKENQAQLDYEKAAGVSRADILRRGSGVTYETNLAQMEQMLAGAKATEAQATGTRAAAAGTMAQSLASRAQADVLRSQGITADAVSRQTRAAAAGSRAQAGLTSTQGTVGLISSIPAALTSGGKVYDWWKMNSSKSTAAPVQQYLKGSFDYDTSNLA